MIDYERLGRSQTYYAENGFYRIEVPWIINSAITDLTKPSYVESHMIANSLDALVGSGEQSFLYMYMKGHLPEEHGRYQTITPCFRQDSTDFIHNETFMKNELIILSEVNEKTLIDVIDICKVFFYAEIGVKPELITAYDESGLHYDLECKGVEVGSYGIRDLGFLKYIYATGCAEPRTTAVKKMIKGK